MTQTLTTYVLDARAFIAGILPAKAREIYVTEGVLGELRGTPQTASRALAYLEARRVKKIEVDESDLATVRERASRIGESEKLSDADLEVAAAAVGLSQRRKRVKVLTDDYALQNLLSNIGIDYERLTHPGITQEIRYRYRCSVCGKVSARPLTQCPDCGSRVVRVRSTARRITRNQSP
jgi:rRNA maturation endonuclease Nob1